MLTSGFACVEKVAGLERTSPNIFRDIGFNTYQMGRYAEAIALFSLYVSMYRRMATVRTLCTVLHMPLPGLTRRCGNEGVRKDHRRVSRPRQPGTVRSQ